MSTQQLDEALSSEKGSNPCIYASSESHYSAPCEESPYVGISELADVVFSVFAKRRLMAMLGAYFDESGTHRGSPVLAVAGCVSYMPQWKRLERDWQKALFYAGVEPEPETNIRVFHMSEYESRQGVFEGWSPKKRVAVIKNLSETMKRNLVLGVAVVVVVDDYLEATARRNEPANPYLFCVVRCMTLIQDWIRGNSIKDKIAYVLEDKPGQRGEIYKKRDLILSYPPLEKQLNFHSLTFAKKSEVIPLQPADFLAYESMKYFHNQITNSGRDVRKSLKGLLLSSRTGLPVDLYDGEYFDKAQLQHLAEWMDMPNDVGSNEQGK